MADLWFYLGTDHNCITEILFKMTLNTITLSVAPRMDRVSFYLNTIILLIYDNTDIHQVVSFISLGVFGFYFDNRWGQDLHNSFLFEHSAYYHFTINILQFYHIRQIERVSDSCGQTT